MIQTKARFNEVINLGMVGENESREILFDISDWLEKFPSCIITLIFKPAEAFLPYEVDINTDTINKVASWTVGKHELMNPGQGYCQLNATLNDQLVKSVIYKTFVSESLDDIQTMEGIADIIYPGSTPTLQFYVNLDLSELGNNFRAELTCAQNDKIILTKTKSNMSIDEDNRKIYINLTRQDTLLFNPRYEIEMQLRLKSESEKIYTSDIMIARVGKSLNTGELQ